MSVGLPNCFVDIYPYEGGSFTFQGFNGTLQAVTTDKNIWDPQSGTFTLTLAPNGPFGPNANPQWIDIIRPMSLTVITMQRLGRARVVMIGVIRTVQEQEIWQPGSGVRRGLVVHGKDFGHIFSQPNFFASLLFNFTKGAVLTAGGALGSILGLGTQNITLDQAAQAWYSKVMAGTSGLLSNMNFAYQGSRVSFNNLVSTFFGTYPNLKLEIPSAQNYAVMEGTWLDTFGALYPFPWFELFVTTAEPNDYGQAAAATPLQSTLPGIPQASPVLIARPSPIPVLSGAQGGGFSIDMTLWNQLPIAILDSLPFVRGTSFNDSDVKNLYAVVPTYLGTLLGGQNGDVTPLLYQAGVYVDSASIERYGYRPFVFNPNWFADPNGDVARSTSAGGGIQAFVSIVGEIALKAASYFEPTPLMANLSISTNLRPDILPGIRLQFPPTKDNELWDFYITGVHHEWEFGGNSITSLELARGLPTDVYNDQDLMLAILSGNAMRQDGNYLAGLPAGSGAPLQNIGFNNGTDIASAISAVYNTPGLK